LRIIDISNLASPVEVGAYDTPGWAIGLAVSGDYAYVADYAQGLRVIDISNPASPNEVGSVSTPANSAFDVSVRGDYAYVADGTAGLRIIDISDPAAPTEVGFYDAPGNAQGVAVAESHAYLATYGSGLRVINIDDPAAPYEDGFYDTPGTALEVALGEYAYVADGANGLVVVDVSDPSFAVTEVGSAPGNLWSLVVDGDYVFAADNDNGLRVFDISDATTPTEVGFYDTPCTSTRGVAFNNCQVYATDFAGLGIYSFLPLENLVIEPLAPEIVVQAIGQSAQLTWSPILVEDLVYGCPVAGVTHYLVFYSPTSDGEYYYHGFTTGTSYTHEGVITYAPGMFYQVYSMTSPPPALQLLPTGGVMTMSEALSRLTE